MNKAGRDQLGRWVREWQRILRLQDWKVKAFLKREDDMSVPDADGVCHFQITKKRGHIELRDPIDFGSPSFPVNLEQVIVHELLHLHFAPFQGKAGSPQLLAQEQAIEAIADALIELKRKG